MTKILAIDDERNNLVLVKATMKKYLPDCKILIAQSGEEGIIIANEELPDAILLDVMMPGLNGYEVCELLKSNEKTKGIPIVFFSAYVKDSHGIIKGLELGADAFLKKPIDPSELAAQMKVVLRIKKAEDRIKIERDKYQTLANTIPDPIISISMDEEITYISPAAIDLFAFDSNQKIIGENAYKLLFSTHQSEFRQLLNELLVSDRVCNFSLDFIRKDGISFYAEISAAAIRDDKGETKEFVLLIKDLSHWKENETQILEYQKNLKLMNAKLSRVEEKERRAIAEYLHDGVGQKLSLAYMHLSTIDEKQLDKKEKKSLSESKKMVNSAIDESRNLTFDLSPPILYELGLLQAIKWKLQQVEEKYGLKTSFRSDGPFEMLDADQRIILFRAVIELITNVIKHAKASLLSVYCYTEEMNLIIEIDDDGKGFDQTEIEKADKVAGFGVFNIKERLDSIDGILKIDSEKNKGTQARIFIPLKK